MNGRRLPIIAEIGLVMVAWIAAAIAAVAQIGCVGGSGGTRGSVSVICDSSSAETAYNAILVAGAVIALVAAVTSHVVDRRRVALLGCPLSLALIAGAFIWASATKSS